MEIQDRRAAQRIMLHPCILHCHKDYRYAVAWRYLTLAAVSPETALQCLDAGYTSPSAAHMDGLLPRQWRQKVFPSVGRAGPLTIRDIPMRRIDHDDLE